MEYDPGVLKAVEVSALAMLSGSYWQANTGLDGEVRLAFAALNALREGGDLFALTFEVLPHTEGQVTNALGQLMRTLNLGKQPAEVYLLNGKAAYWDGKDASGQDIANGVYFYQLQADDLIAGRRMTLLE